MTNEWQPFPDRDDSRDTPIGDDLPSTPPPATTNHDEDTRVLPPQLGASQDTAPSARRRTGVLPAAVLAGALVVGGVAGVGGAAGYVALRGGSSTGSSSPDLSATNRTTASSANNSQTSGTIETVAAKVLPSVVQINVAGANESGSGSGIVLTKDGTILTNNHVVAVAGSGGSIRVNFNDGTSARAKVVGTDPVTDIAVIKADGVAGLTPAEIGTSSDLKVGEGVVAIGSPFGLGATVTSGIVSALDRAVSVQSSQGGQGSQGSNPFGQQQPQGSADQSTTYPAIQTDAAINPGNSGGPLVNMLGQVIGINSSIRTASSSSSTGQGGSIGLGFAIPMDEVLPIVNQLRGSQTPTHARLGVSVSNNETSNSDQTGAQVKTLENGAAADAAGLKVGDVITKVDQQLIDSSDALVATIRGHRPGDTVRLTVLRGGQTTSITAKLGSDANRSTS
ncbi:MAG: trypsin-like peptidase domain-containing protein [Marmoricola sp.]